MNYRTITVIAVSIVVIMLIFPAANIIYPDHTIQKVPLEHEKNIKEKLFLNESNYNFNNYNKTYFDPTGNKTTVIEGYVYNHSANKTIDNKNLYVIMGNYYSIANINSTGFYKVDVLLSGNGTFYFKVPDYNGIYKKISLNGNNYYYNLSLSPEEKYKFYGYTLLNNKSESDVNLLFSGIFNTLNATSNSNGYFELYLYNQTYNISAHNYNLKSITDPENIKINGSNLNENIMVYQTNKPVYKISGYVYNDNGTLLKNVTITDTYGTVYTNNSGYYVINASYGNNIINFYESGYSSINKTVNVINNRTLNVTLPDINPFSGPNKGYGGLNSGYGNSTAQKHVNSSKVNYSNKTSIILMGNINTTYNTFVSYNYIHFIINVSNTYFYDNVTTNYSGTYIIPLNYTGYYHIIVYSPLYHIKIINVSALNKINYKNFTLTPLNKFIYNINGYVNNKDNNLGINGTIIIENSKPSILIEYKYNKTYNITLPSGYYKILYYSSGFYTNTKIITNLSKNTTINENLTPVNSIGNNINIYSSKNNINKSNITDYIPYISNKNINNNLTINQLNGTKNITITLDFGKNVADQKFMLLIKENGVIYYYLNKTNNYGYSTIKLYYTGNYTISGYFLNYTITQKNYSLYENGTIHPNITNNPEYNYNLTVKSYYAINNTYSVPYENIKAYGGIFNIYYNNASSNKNGTYFNYLLPYGIYNITYNNIHYTNSSFNISISNLNGKSLDKVYAYIIDLNVKSNVSYNYTLTYNGGIYNNITNNTYLTSYGINNIKIYKNNIELYNYNITLNKANPSYYVNATINSNLNNTSYKHSDINSGKYNYTYSLNFNNTVYIYKITIPHNVVEYLNKYNYTIYDNGVEIENGTRSGQYINITNGISAKGNITIDIYGYMNGTVNSTTTSAVIYNYNVNIKSNNLNE